MNVFLLSSGRCGSTSIIEACRFVTNYTAAHESRMGLLGPDRLRYPARHIEADNRLTWMLGRLEEAYGDQAAYVHQVRNREATAGSFVRRYDQGIIHAYRTAIHYPPDPTLDPMLVAGDYCDTVNANIRTFLRDKSKTMLFRLEHASEDFARFWEFIGAEGDLDSALATWGEVHNESGFWERRRREERWRGNVPKRIALKAARALKGLPRYLAEA